MNSMLERLKERKLVQWALAYLAGAWVLLQVLDVLGQNFDWPRTVFRSATAVLAGGFFAVLILAWYHGEKGAQRVTAIEALLLTGVLLIAGGVVRTVGGSHVTESEPATPPLVRSIAVLPFRNMSADSSNAFFAAGVHEEVLTQLSKVRDLKVISRTSVMGYARGERNLREIGKVLGVGTILEGSVQRAGDRVRIAAQLIDARTDQQLWAERYDRDLKDIFAIQSEVAFEIAKQLNATLSAGERERIEKRPTENLAAYDLYLRGRQVGNARSRDGLQRAIDYFEEAIRLDSTFAAAYSGLADAHWLLTSYSFLPRSQAIPRARAAAARALALDSLSAEAHTSLGVLLDGSRSWSLAEREFRRAIELRPGYAQAHHWYALHLLKLGRTAEGLREIRRASELDPLSPALGVVLSLALSASGSHDGAIAVARQTTEIEPAFAGGHAALADALAAVSRFPEAFAAARKTEELSTASPIALSTAGAVYARTGHLREAREVLFRLERMPTMSAAFAGRAVIHANLGQKDTAFALLRREADWTSNLLLVIRNTAVWNPLRSDPRWPALMQPLGLEP